MFSEGEMGTYGIVRLVQSTRSEPENGKLSEGKVHTVKYRLMNGSTIGAQ
jgi:hypothetical protein